MEKMDQIDPKSQSVDKFGGFGYPSYGDIYWWMKYMKWTQNGSENRKKASSTSMATDITSKMDPTARSLMVYHQLLWLWIIGDIKKSKVSTEFYHALKYLNSVRVSFYLFLSGFVGFEA